MVELVAVEGTLVEGGILVVMDHIPAVEDNPVVEDSQPGVGNQGLVVDNQGFQQVDRRDLDVQKK